MNKTQYELNPKSYWEVPELMDFKYGYTEIPPLELNPLWTIGILPEVEKSRRELCVDLGCGAGRYIGYASKYFKNVLGVDFARHSLNQAQQLMDAAKIKNVTFYEASLASMPDIKDKSVDFGYTGAVFTHIPNDVKKQALKEVARILKPDGVIALFEVFVEDNEAFDCPAISEDEFIKMVNEAGMKCEVKRFKEFNLSEYKLTL